MMGIENGGTPSAVTIICLNGADLVCPSPVSARHHPACGVALVHRGQRRRSEPIRAPGSRDADQLWASCIDHAVKDSDTNGSFGLLIGQLAGMEVVAEDALVS